MVYKSIKLLATGRPCHHRKVGPRHVERHAIWEAHRPDPGTVAAVDLSEHGPLRERPIGSDGRSRRDESAIRAMRVAIGGILRDCTALLKDCRCNL